ncbi:MAG: hypothetical protein IKO19_13560 [Candidatus Riflebacteria bacterium]|nr:hypothetical protein [Candidatus Riflebacteria bacterium]
MIEPNYKDLFDILCSFAASEGRGPKLFGEDVLRLSEKITPFLIGPSFPNIYLEFPLIGKPFLDATILYNDIESGTRIISTVAGDCSTLLDWYAEVRKKHQNISFGFELDTDAPENTQAAIHFQPRRSVELVEPFCKIIGEEERGKLYLEVLKKMPAGWPLSFFGIFRGRKNAPLRVCGYIDDNIASDVSKEPMKIKAVFDKIGFKDYDNHMLEQISKIILLSYRGIDFQFDVYPDGSFGDTFALDVELKERASKHISKAFENGVSAELMNILKSWGIADERTSMLKDLGLSRFIKITSKDNTEAKFGFTLSPDWIKIRWKKSQLQPSKCYSVMNAKRL